MVTRVAGHELGLAAAGARHRPDRIRAGAARDEGDRRAVGRPCGLPVVGGVAREPAKPAPVRSHRDDVAAAVAIGGEGDVEAVGRPGGLAVRARMRHDRVQAAARRIDHPQIPATRRARPVENDVGSVRRPARVSRRDARRCQRDRGATVCRHGPERELATVGLSHERDLRAVRGVGGVGVDVGVIRQHHRRRPVRGHAHDLVVAR